MSVSNGTRQMVPWLISQPLDAKARKVGSIPQVMVPLGQLDSFLSAHGDPLSAIVVDP